MPDYLTKEEIRQWRSSLERITLEEYAKRLGKVISDEKETNDMVDMVYKHSAPVRYVSNDESSVVKNNFKAERISSLAQQSFEREKEISLEKAERDLRKTLNKNKHAEKAAIAKAKELKEIHKLLHIAWDKYQDDDRYVNVSSAGQYIKRAKPDFDARTYGFLKLPDLIEAYPNKYAMKRYPGKGTVTIIAYKCI